MIVLNSADMWCWYVMLICDADMQDADMQDADMQDADMWKRKNTLRLLLA